MSGQRRAQYVSIPLGPGVLSNPTGRAAHTRLNYMNWDRWKDASWVRWHKLMPEKIGGWQYQALIDSSVGNPTVYLGMARGLHDWASYDNQYWVAIGTHLKLYIVNNGVLFDITPIRNTANLNNALSTTNTSPIVNVTDNGAQGEGHQANTGDFVDFPSPGVTVGGITLLGTYQVSVIDPFNYTVVAAMAATSTVTDGGGAISINYEMYTGLGANGELLGYGTGEYGEGTYGTPRAAGTGVLARMRTWSLENYGQDLIASESDGEIYWWQWITGPQSRAAILANAPLNVQRCLVDAAQRVIIACGSTDITSAYDPLLVSWCSLDDITDWDPTDENTAGDYQLTSGSRIVTANKTQGQNLIWTDTTLYRMVFAGGTDIYDFYPVGKCYIVGPNAMVDVDGVDYFMGFDNFYNYSGTLNLQACDVWYTVFDPNSVDADGYQTALDPAQSESVVCYTLEPKTEVTWLYSSLNQKALSVTFSGSIDQYATSAELEVPWAGDSGLYNLLFSDQEAQVVALSNGSTAASWALPLTANVSATAQVIGNDRYVSFNWEDGTWYAGVWNRTCARGRAPAMAGYPYGVNAGYLYQHEIGTDAVEPFGTVAIPWYAESLDITIGGAKSEYTMGGSDARFTIGGSDSHLRIVSMLPDWQYMAGEMNITLLSKDRPQDAEYVVDGPVAFDSSDVQIDIDAHGSQVVIRLDNLTLVTDVVLLLHMDAANGDGDTDFIDSSVYGNPISVNGFANMQTEIVKFGAGAGDFTGDSSGQEAYILTPVIPAGSPLDIGTGDFTVEFWAYPLDLSTDTIPFGFVRSDIVGTLGYVEFVGNEIQFNCQGGISNGGTPSPSSLTVNAWHHVAMCVQDGMGYGFVDGVQIEGSPFACPSPVPFGIGNITQIMVGADSSDTTLPFYNGYIDEVRIIKGRALYTGNFSPPSAPFEATYPNEPSLGSKFRMGVWQGLAFPYAKR